MLQQRRQNPPESHPGKPHPLSVSLVLALQGTRTHAAVGEYQWLCGWLLRAAFGFQVLRRVCATALPRLPGVVVAAAAAAAAAMTSGRLEGSAVSEGTRVPSKLMVRRYWYLRNASVAMQRTCLVFVCLCGIAAVVAPAGEPTGAILARLADAKRANAGASAMPSTGVLAAAGAAVLVGMAAAACSSIGSSSCAANNDGAGIACGPAAKSGRVDSIADLLCDECSSESSDDCSSPNASDLCSSLGGDDCRDDSDEEAWKQGTRVVKGVRSQATNSSCGKLWTKALFPEGVLDAANWDLKNLQAAQRWECPCPDRANCIGSDRLSVLDLYDYRKRFRTTAKSHGGFRDAARKELDDHFDPSTGMFARSFKVGPLVDCCAPSAGLAKGLSFATWAASRADSKHNREKREGRKRLLGERESVERAHLNAYIRSLRDGMEGPKGGFAVHDKWRTGKVPISRRWEEYTRRRHQMKLPVIGSIHLFRKLWNAHKEIREFTALGHAKCDRCALQYTTTVPAVTNS